MYLIKLFMKQVKLLAALLLFVLGASAQSVTPDPGPYTPMNQKYQYRWLKTIGGIWNTGKFVQVDSAQFSGITYVPTVADADSTTKAANSAWVKKLFATGNSGSLSKWDTAGNAGLDDPRLGTTDNSPFALVTNNTKRLIMPAAGILAADSNYVFLVKDTINGELKYTTSGGGGGTDTTSLSNRINLKLNISDTASMLSNYAKTSAVALKVNISDTSAMLDRYLDTLQAHNTRIIGKQTIVTLTTTGTNVAATFTPSTGALNIPNYALGALYNSDGTLTSARTISSGGFPLTLSGTNIASSGVSRGFNFTNTLQAAANNDVLTAIDIAPTFTNGAFSNVRNYGIRSGADIAFTNTANRALTVQQSSNIIEGRSLTINGGSANSTGLGTFDPLLQTNRQWTGMTQSPNGNVYAGVYGGDIYMQTNGTGNFVALSQASRSWFGMAAAPNGNVYAAVQNGDIYMQTNGTGNFNALSQTFRNWYGMTAAPNGNVYAVVSGGDIYMQTNGTGNFVALGQTSRNWIGMAAAANGNVYASVSGGDIYMQTNGTGNFVALSQTTRFWSAMAAAPNGNVYAAVENGDIYMQTNGTGNFVALSQTTRQWYAMVGAANGNVYAAHFSGDIYMQTDIAGTPNLNGGSLILTSGAGKGTGTSTISFQTGTTLDSSTTLQTLSTKMTILGNGNVGIGTTTPNATAKLDISDTAKGILIPRMTTTQRNAISSPATALQVFSTTDSTNYIYRGTTSGWQATITGIRGSGTLDFGSIAHHSEEVLTFTVTGAAEGDVVSIGVPNASNLTNVIYTAWVSAANTVSVKCSNLDQSAAKDPASGTFKVTVFK
jgi:hypothetical protein